MEETSQTIRINWQRLPLAIVGLLGVLGTPVTLVLAAFSVVGWSAPLLFAFLAVASVGSLRLLVLRQKYKPYGYHQTPTAASYQRKVVPGLAPKSATVEPFDGAGSKAGRLDDGAAEGAKDEATPHTDIAHEDTAESSAEPNTEQLNITGIDDGQHHEAQTTRVAETWEPVDVPAPTYTREAKVERSEPEPLELPEPPRASINRLKDTLPAPEDTLRQEQERMIRTSVRAHQPKAGALNLDDVLARRRA